MLTLTKGTVPLPLSVSPVGDLKCFNHNTPSAALIISAVSVNTSDGSALQHALPVCGWQTSFQGLFVSEDRRLRFSKAQSWRLMMTEHSISSGVQSLCLMMIEHSIFSEVQSWRLNGDIWGSHLVLCVSLVNTRSWPIPRLKGEQSAKMIFSCATDGCIAACLQPGLGMKAVRRPPPSPRAAGF